MRSKGRDEKGLCGTVRSARSVIRQVGIHIYRVVKSIGVSVSRVSSKESERGRGVYEKEGGRIRRRRMREECCVEYRFCLVATPSELSVTATPRPHTPSLHSHSPPQPSFSLLYISPSTPFVASFPARPSRPPRAFLHNSLSHSRILDDTAVVHVSLRIPVHTRVRVSEGV